MPPSNRKKTSPRTAKKAGAPAPAAATIDSITTDLSKINFNQVFPTFNYICPVIPVHAKLGDKHAIYFDVYYPSAPQSNLKYCKVLPGGMKVAFLIAAPKWMCSERVLKAEMGVKWDTSDVHVQARSQQITHLIAKKYPVRENFISGNPQVIDCPSSVWKVTLKLIGLTGLMRWLRLPGVSTIISSLHF